MRDSVRTFRVLLLAGVFAPCPSVASAEGSIAREGPGCCCGQVPMQVQSLPLLSGSRIYLTLCSGVGLGVEYPTGEVDLRVKEAKSIVSEDGVVVVSSPQGVRAVDAATKRVLWTHEPRRDGSGRAPDVDVYTAVSGGVAVFKVGNNPSSYLQALDARTGAPRWTFSGSGTFLGERFVSDRFLFASDGATIFALEVRSGELLWSAKADTAEIAGVSGGYLFSREDGLFVARDVMNGRRRWVKELQPEVVLGTGEVVFALSKKSDGFVLTSLEVSTGVVRFHRRFDHGAPQAVISADGKVLIIRQAARDPSYRTLLGISVRSGQVLWKRRGETDWLTPVAVRGDIVVVRNSGELVQISVATGKYGRVLFDAGSLAR